MTDSTASVAALLPAWNSAGFIQRTLDSLSAQTWPAFQVIVSVDLCDDDTLAVCEAHAARDARFRVLRQDRRLGYVGNCNALLEAASTDYALFAFHDDTVAPTYVERLARVLEARPEVVMSFSDLLLTHLSGREQHCSLTALEGLKDRLQRGGRMLGQTRNWWVPNRGMFRLDAARAIGGLKAHAAGEFSADLPWLFHMSLLGEFARVPETLCFKNYMPGSLTRTWAFSPRQRYEVLAACLRELWNTSLTTHEKARLASNVTLWLAEHPPREGA